MWCFGEAIKKAPPVRAGQYKRDRARTDRDGHVYRSIYSGDGRQADAFLLVLQSNGA